MERPLLVMLGAEGWVHDDSIDPALPVGADVPGVLVNQLQVVHLELCTAGAGVISSGTTGSSSNPYS